MIKLLVFRVVTFAIKGDCFIKSPEPASKYPASFICEEALADAAISHGEETGTAAVVDTP